MVGLNEDGNKLISPTCVKKPKVDTQHAVPMTKKRREIGGVYGGKTVFDIGSKSTKSMTRPLINGNGGLTAFSMSGYGFNFGPPAGSVIPQGSQLGVVDIR